MSKILKQKINQQFLTKESFLLISHQNPDGDACGSLLGLWFYLRQLGKKAAIFSVSPAPSYLDFLPSFEIISRRPEILAEQWEAVVILDSGDWKHTGVNNFNFKKAVIINFDHHFTNQNFGDINLVDNQASSTCEIIYRFFKEINFKMDRKIATCLLTGILTDTNGFANAATTSQAMAITSDLIYQGAKVNLIAAKAAGNKSIEGLRLWGLLLSRLKFNQEFNFVYTYIKDDEFRKFRVNEEEIDGFVNLLNVINEAAVAMFLQIFPRQLKVSLRTKDNSINLAQLAKIFGGGGHQKAAGFTVPWTVEETGGGLRIV